MTNDEFREKISLLYNNDFEPIEIYNSYDEKILFKHKVCNNQFEMTPHDFLRNNRKMPCPKCRKLPEFKLGYAKEHKPQKVFEDQVYKKYGSEYKILGEYINCHKIIEILHTPCGKKYFTTPTNFLSGSKCPACARLYKTINNTKNFIDNHLELSSFSVSFPPYTMHGNRGKLLFTHTINETSHSYLMTSYDFIVKGYRCPICNKDKFTRKTIDEIKEELQKKFNGEYELVSTEYKNNKTPILFKHSCGQIFSMKLNKLLQGQRCPCQRYISKAEQKIKTFLQKNNIEFEHQKIFQDCKDKSFLPFDFYLSKYNLLIEFDGELHYNLSNRNNAEDKLKNTIEHDEIKNLFAKNNNINLLRIPYTEYQNLNKILNKLYKYLQNPSNITFDNFLLSLNLNYPKTN